MIRRSNSTRLAALGLAAVAVTLGIPAHGDGKTAAVDIDQIHKQFAAKDALIADLKKQVATLQAELDKLKGSPQAAVPATPIAAPPASVAIPAAVAMDVLPKYHAIVLEALPKEATGRAVSLNPYGQAAGYSLNVSDQSTPVMWDLRTGAPAQTYGGGAMPYPGQPGAMMPGMMTPGMPAGAGGPGGRGYPGYPGGYPGGTAGFGAAGAAGPQKPKYDSRIPTKLGNDTGGASAINVLGAIAGSTGGKVILWVKGKPQDLGSPDGLNSVEVLGINNKGDIVGDGVNANGDHVPFFKPSGGPFQTLALLSGWDSGFAERINDIGMIAGRQLKSGADTHACFWINGAATDLGTLGGATSSATGINNSGVIVGVADTADKKAHACYWKLGKIHDLAQLDGTDHSRANAISDSGVIVGQAGDNIAVAWVKDKPYNLNDAVTDKGFTIKEALAMDSNGGILVRGNVPGKKNERSILLVPTKATE